MNKPDQEKINAIKLSLFFARAHPDADLDAVAEATLDSLLKLDTKLPRRQELP